MVAIHVQKIMGAQPVKISPPRSTRVTGSDLELDVLSTLDEIDALRPEWNGLLQQDPARNLFLTHAWNRAWWHAFRSDKALRLLAIRCHGRLVGLAPYMLYTSRIGGMSARVLGTFTNPHVSRTNVLIAPGYSHAVARQIANYCKRSAHEWDVALLQQIPVASTWLQPFLEHATDIGLLPLPMQAGVSKCFLPITKSWDSYVEERGTHFRRNIGKTERRVAKGGTIAYRHCVDPVAAATDFAIFQDVESRSWKGAAVDGVHLGTQGWAFQQEFATAYKDGISCDNWVVELDDRPVAIVHTVGYDRVNYCFQTLYDESTKDLYIGRAAVTRHFENVFRCGLYDALDLNGDSDFCKSWSTREQSFVSLQMFNRRPYSAMLWGLKKAWGMR